MNRRGFIVLIPLALLTGCASVGEIEPRATIRLPDNFVFAPLAQNSATDVGESLLPQSDPAFAALMTYVNMAPDLGIALARIDAARAVAQRAKADRMPAISVSADTGVVRNTPEQFGNLPPGTAFDSTRFSIGGDINAQWDIDLFGRLRATQKAAKARLDAANFDAQAVRIALTSEIAAAVIDWQNIQAQRNVLDSNIRAAEQRAQLVASRVRAGLNPGLDRMRADAIVAALRAQRPTLDGDEAQIVARMVALTAQPTADVLNALRQSVAPQKLGKSPYEAPSALLAARPDIQAAAARLAASDAELAATAAARFPRFTLSSTIGLLAFALGGVFDTDAITGQLGAGIAGPLLDFGRIEADIAQNKAQTRIAFEELRKATFAALAEAEGSFATLSASERSAELLSAQAGRETEVARVSASRQRAGLESMIAVLDADRIAYQAQQQAIAAQGRVQRAKIALWQSLGGPGLSPSLTPNAQ